MNFESIEDPLNTVDDFRERAAQSGLAVPEAMVLATVDAKGEPHARVVLYKGRTGRTLQFFTNYSSDKAEQLRNQPRVEVCIHYPSLALQVRMSGAVHELSAELSDAYFESRPRESQVGAWVSQQSRPLASRQQLDDEVAQMEQKFLGKTVPRPDHWGGYGLLVDSVELWVGQAGRLHDRARFKYEGLAWQCQRLYP